MSEQKFDLEAHHRRMREKLETIAHRLSPAVMAKARRTDRPGPFVDIVDRLPELERLFGPLGMVVTHEELRVGDIVIEDWYLGPNSGYDGGGPGPCLVKVLRTPGPLDSEDRGLCEILVVGERYNDEEPVVGEICPMLHVNLYIIKARREGLDEGASDTGVRAE